MFDKWSFAESQVVHTQVRVRYAESDQMGYAHHSSHVVWVEQGRVDWIAQTGMSYRELEAQGVFMPVAKLELRYKRPARFDDMLDVQTALVELGHTRIVFATRIGRQNDDASHTIIADAQVLLATVDHSGHPIRMPDELRQRFSAHLTDIIQP